MSSVRVRPPALAIQRLLEVGPDLTRVLQSHAEPDEVLRYPVAFPAAARLQHRARAAEARGVLDRAHRDLDPAGRLRAAEDVERHEAAEARIADALHCGMRVQPLCDIRCIRGVA